MAEVTVGVRAHDALAHTLADAGLAAVAACADALAVRLIARNRAFDRRRTGDVTNARAREDLRQGPHVFADSADAAARRVYLLSSERRVVVGKRVSCHVAARG